MLLWHVVEFGCRQGSWPGAALVAVEHQAAVCVPRQSALTTSLTRLSSWGGVWYQAMCEKVHGPLDAAD